MPPHSFLLNSIKGFEPLHTVFNYYQTAPFKNNLEYGTRTRRVIISDRDNILLIIKGILPQNNFQIKPRLTNSAQLQTSGADSWSRTSNM